MTTVIKNEATMFFLTKEDLDELAKAVGKASDLMWRMRYRREIKIPLPKSDKIPTVRRLESVAKVSGAEDLEDF